MAKEIMNRKEAAEYLGVSLSHFATFQNKISQVRLGTSVRFRKEDVDIFVKNNTVHRCKYCGEVIENWKYCCEDCYNIFEEE